MNQQLDHNLILSDEPDKVNKNKHLLAGLLFVLIAFILLVTIFWFYKKNSMDLAGGPLGGKEETPANLIYLSYKDDFALAVEEYLVVQEKISESFKKEIAYFDEYSKVAEEQAAEEPAVLGVDNNSDQEKADLSRGERIARGVATFWEIGRNKHIGEALSVNEEDLRFISLARQGVNFVLADLEKLEIKIPKNHADEIRFLSSLGKYYRGLEKFLYQLKLYKDFNGEQIKAATSGRLVNYSEEITGYYQQSFNLSEEAKFQYLNETMDQAGRLYREGAAVFKESESGLKDSVIPPDFIDPDILAELVRLRLELFGRAIEGFEEAYSSMELKKKDGAMNSSSAQEEKKADLSSVFDQINQTLLRLKVSSNMSNLFNEIAKEDKEIKDNLLGLRGKYNFFMDENQPYLIDLMARYQRSQSERYAELEAYSRKAAEELDDFRVGASSFVLNKPSAKIKVSLIIPAECNQGVIFYLKSPIGSIISKDNLLLYDNASFGTTFNTLFFIIDNPEVGRWETEAKLPVDCADFEIEAREMGDSSLQKYRNEEYGFEIEYPSDWKSSSHAAGILPLQYEDKDGRMSFFNLSVKRGAMELPETAEKISIAGKQAYLYFYQEGAGTSAVYLLPLEEIYIQMEFDYLGMPTNSAERMLIIKEIMNPIILSFKFIK